MRHPLEINNKTWLVGEGVFWERERKKNRPHSLPWRKSLKQVLEEALYKFLAEARKIEVCAVFYIGLGILISESSLYLAI